MTRYRFDHFRLQPRCRCEFLEDAGDGVGVEVAGADGGGVDGAEEWAVVDFGGGHPGAQGIQPDGREVGDSTGTFGIVLGATDEKAGSAEVSRLQVLEPQGDELAAAAERVEADGTMARSRRPVRSVPQAASSRSRRSAVMPRA